MSTLHLKSPHVTLGSLVNPERGARHLLSLLTTWQRRAHQRAELARLTPELLRDTGLDPRAVAAEAAKPFWKA